MQSVWLTILCRQLRYMSVYKLTRQGREAKTERLIDVVSLEKIPKIVLIVTADLSKKTKTRSHAIDEIMSKTTHRLLDFLK